MFEELPIAPLNAIVDSFVPMCRCGRALDMDLELAEQAGEGWTVSPVLCDECFKTRNHRTYDAQCSESSRHWPEDAYLDDLELGYFVTLLMTTGV